MIIDLALATVLRMRTERFMDIDIDMAMFHQAEIAPQNLPNSIQKLAQIDSKVIQHGAKTGLRTAC